MSGATITLKFPASSGPSALTLRRPKVRDMLASDKTKGSDAEKEIALFANLCEVAPADIESLDMADYQALQKAYQGFLS
jgi:hypothetical protein